MLITKGFTDTQISIGICRQITKGYAIGKLSDVISDGVVTNFDILIYQRRIPWVKLLFFNKYYLIKSITKGLLPSENLNNYLPRYYVHRQFEIKFNLIISLSTSFFHPSPKSFSLSPPINLWNPKPFTWRPFSSNP